MLTVALLAYDAPQMQIARNLSEREHRKIGHEVECTAMCSQSCRRETQRMAQVAQEVSKSSVVPAFQRLF